MTRGAIRAAAADRFFVQGFEATTVREIAGDLDIRAASIYHHYADKQQILYDLVSSTMTLLETGVGEAVRAETDPSSRLTAFVVHHVALHALRPREATLGETELRSLAGERRDGVIALRDAYEALLRDVLADGAAAGVFVLDDPVLARFAIVAMCTNVGIWYRPDGRLDLSEVAARYAAMAHRVAGAAPPDPAVIGRHLRLAVTRYTPHEEEHHGPANTRAVR